MIRITVVAGKESFTYDYEGKAELKIGRLADNHLVIAHTDVSRAHLSIVPTPEGGWKARDHASRNGILVNGDRTAEAPLKPGDEIQIGTDVVIYFGGEPKPAPGAGGELAAAKKEKEGKEKEKEKDAPREKDSGREKREAPAAKKDEPPAKDKERDKEKDEEDKAAEPAAESEEEVAVAAAAASRGVRPIRRRPRTSGAQSAATFLGLAIFLAGAGYGGWMILQEDTAPVPRGADAESRPAVDVAAVPRLEVGGGGSKPTTPSTARRRDAEDAREWERLNALDLEGELLIGALDAFVLKYPSSPHAAEAKRRVASLRRVKDGGTVPPRAGEEEGGGMVSPALEAEMLTLLRQGAFGDAAYLVQVASRLGAADDAGAERLRRTVEKQAREKFQEARERGRALVKEGRPLEAYELVAQVGIPLRRLSFFPEVEAELAALKRSTATKVATPEAVVASGADRAALDRLVPEARRALIACDFDGALDRYRQIMALPLTDAERLEYQWKIFDIRRARDLWKKLLQHIASPPANADPILVTLTQSIKAEVIDADAVHVKMKAIIKGESERPLVEKRWKDLPPVQLLEMFRCLPLDGDSLLALAAFAFEAEYEADGHLALCRIWEPPGWPAFKGEAAALLARKTGVAVPPDQLIVFEERVIPIAERDKVLAARAAAREEAKRLAEELAAAKREDKLSVAFDWAAKKMEAGEFVEGRAVLLEIAKLERKYPESDVVKKARAKWEDPLMRRRPIEIQGRDENRISINFLAEGYTCEKNADQQAFDRTADMTWKILKKMEPWVEYQEWFNYYAINLRSNDKGISREPGGIKKDTPCGGLINGGTFTVNNAMARSWVERFPGPSQAVCIGNDNASVATGGGGAVAVVKGMIDVTGHELGHSFGNLLDEYDFSPGGDPAPPAAPGPIPTEVIGYNVVKGNQKDDIRAKAPWQHWMKLGTANWTGKIVDIFEGAATVPKDHWRAQVDCKMRTSSSNFCCVCMEQMILRIYEQVRPIDEVDPKDERLEITTDEKLILKATCLRPKAPRAPLDGRWEIRDVSQSENPDGSTVVREEKPRTVEGKSVDLGDGRHLYGVQIKDLKPGLYDISFTVSDPTPWVQQADRSVLSETRTWRVRVRQN